MRGPRQLLQRIGAEHLADADITVEDRREQVIQATARKQKSAKVFEFMLFFLLRAYLRPWGDPSADASSPTRSPADLTPPRRCVPLRQSAMSTPMSSAPRGTPSLTIAPTQNTAPVIKFRCLYTHDLRRKAKRWQDGFLRFHTFNKRVMVYDTTGNFIGDLHWRESEEIQDGDELELDKGVLIQVGECMETTQSDISGLFEKKRQSQGSPPQKTAVPPPSRASTPRSSGVVSQTPLKSLNDLLGIKKTPIGRSITPASPYKQWHQRAQAVEKEQFERPAKRQRQLPPEDILHGKNPNERIRSRPPVIDLEESTASARPAKQSPAPKVRSEKHEDNARSSFKVPSVPATERTRSRPSVIDLEESAPSVPLAKSVSEPRVRSEKNENSAGPSSKVPSVPVTSSDHSQSRQPEKQKGSSDPVPSLTPGSNARAIASEKPINALRISSEKPRKKLMYRALLPADTASTHQDEVSAPPQSTTRSHQHGHTRSPDHEMQNTAVESTAAEFIPSASTLFVLGEMIDEPVTAATSARREVKPSSSLSEPNYLYAIPQHCSRDSASPDSPAERSAPTTSRTNQSQPAPRQRQTAVSDSAARQSDLSSRNNNSDSNTMAAVQTEPPPRPPVSVNRSVPPNPVAAREPPQKIFRKSLSDPTVLRTTTGNRSRPVSNNGQSNIASNATDDDQGPWTSEALDLFDWWPPGRPKPA
ncbi:hypothetical protein VTN00DRAFT_1239 [Thermoascus crustaceus]|uniref:uncharacterized protein n=1 Tax=Thermoascus crustaceus TaxID=5088 RepID=UPI00374290AA